MPFCCFCHEMAHFLITGYMFSIMFCVVLQYILVKFLEPRQDSAGKISIVGIKFFGFVRKPVLIDDTVVVSLVS